MKTMRGGREQDFDVPAPDSMTNIKTITTMKTMKRTLFRDSGRVSAALTLSFGLLLASCADGLEPAEGSDGSAVRFTVSAVQDFGTRALHAEDGSSDGKWGFGETAGDSACFPRTDDVAGASGDNSPGASGIIACTSEGDLGEVYLIESEEEYGAYGAYGESGADDGGSVSGSNGKNGRDDAARILTRANITTNISAKFSTIGYRATSSSGLDGASPWFHNAETKADGTLVTPVYWWDTHPYACFYAIYPYTANGTTDKIRLSPASYPSTPPYVDFEVEPNVTAQKDLMTACSGEVHYATPGVHPRTDLKFRHALTAIKFAVGPNLSWSKVIDRVEIRNACGQGRYTLSAASDGSGAAWSGLDGRKTFAIGGGTVGGVDYGTIAVNTAQPVETVILGSVNDNCTFLMVPQTLTGNGVVAYIHFTDNTAITATLTGRWKRGTVKTYKLSNTASNWEYKLETTSPAPVNCNTTSTGDYTIRSYRKAPAPDATEQPVAWKVVGYRESTDGGATFGSETTTKPAWLTALSLEQGDGRTTGETEETGKATLTADVIDYLAPYNDVLKQAQPKGGSGDYYDLSTHDLDGHSTSRSTANSYLISAPGYYCIPLVYGNAIKNGVANTHAYISQAPTGTPYILRNFQDHAGVDITSPYINVQNASDPATQAGIVWTDQSGIVTDLGVEGSGTGAFVRFRVLKENIRNGNAVISVKNAAGTVMWSWHLWFAQKKELSTIDCTNYQGYVYNFASMTFGFAWRKWEDSTYDQPRTVRVKVEQTVANGGVKQFAYIDITQNNGSVKGVSSTLYQWGRKDAMPGVETVSDGTFTFETDNMSILNGIQHPGTFYIWVNNGTWTTNYNYYNLWSMDNTTVGYNDNPVVKTVYDPCPAGFHIPASNAFTGFTSTGGNVTGTSLLNVTGGWDYGWHFNNRINSPDKTIYFPASGCIQYRNGLRRYVGEVGYSWAAVPSYEGDRCALGFRVGDLGTQYRGNPADAFHIRPVLE